MQATPVPFDYAVVIATLLAVSLAGERIVAIVKTMFPGWFAEPAATPGAPPLSIGEDRGRRLRVQAVAFGACWLAAAALTPNFDFVGDLSAVGLKLPTPLVALLAMGGSAFWSQVLGISSALKDLRTAQANEARGGSSTGKQAPASDRTVHLPNTEIAKPAGAGA